MNLFSLFWAFQIDTTSLPSFFVGFFFRFLLTFIDRKRRSNIKIKSSNGVYEAQEFSIEMIIQREYLFKSHRMGFFISKFPFFLFHFINLVFVS